MWRCWILTDKTDRPRISPNISEKLRRWIMDKHGTLKQGDISYYTEMAINRFLDGEAIPKEELHTHTLRFKQSKKDQELLSVNGGVVNYLADSCGTWDIKKVAEGKLKEAIRAVTGRRDKRTVNSWFDMLIAKGYFVEGSREGSSRSFKVRLASDETASIEDKKTDEFNTVSQKYGTEDNKKKDEFDAAVQGYGIAAIQGGLR